MIKKLSAVGNSLGLIIERPILELLDITKVADDFLRGPAVGPWAPGQLGVALACNGPLEVTRRVPEAAQAWFDGERTVLFRGWHPRPLLAVAFERIMH